MTTQESKVKPHLLSREQVYRIQKEKPPAEELIVKFNEWILSASYLGRCSITKRDLQQVLNCYTRELQSLLIHLQDVGWNITTNNDVLDFY